MNHCSDCGRDLSERGGGDCETCESITGVCAMTLWHRINSTIYTLHEIRHAITGRIGNVNRVTVSVMFCNTVSQDERERIAEAIKDALNKEQVQ